MHSRQIFLHPLMRRSTDGATEEDRRAGFWTSR